MGQWHVCDTALQRTHLALQNEAGQLVAVYPVQLAEHGHAAHHPPAIAHVLCLFGSPIQTPVLELSFAKPGAQLVVVDQVEPPRNGQCSNAGKHLTRVRFGARTCAIAAIEVGTGMDVLDRAGYVDEIEQAHEREGIQRPVQEARVLLSPLIACKGA